MTEQNIQDQIIELTDDQLERVVGGWIPPLMRLPIPPPGVSSLGMRELPQLKLIDPEYQGNQIC